jgi:hypothetical protein
MARHLLLGVMAATLAASCTSSMECERSRDPMESEHCVATGGEGEAAITAVAAVGTWAVVGCRVNGCSVGWTCDDESGMCERARCTEGMSCPPGFQCDHIEGRCE